MAGSLLLRELSRYQIGTFADIIYRNALLYPDNEAFVCGSRRLSFAGFNERTNQLIHGLRGVGRVKGDVLGVLSCNCVEFVEVWGAAMKGGFIIAPFNIRLKDEELVPLLENAKPKTMFVAPEHADIAERLKKRMPQVENWFVFGAATEDMASYEDFVKTQPTDEIEPLVNEEDPLSIYYTSGTTGAPRGAYYTQAQKMQNARIKALDLGPRFGDRNLLVLPLFHVAGDSHIWPFFLTGGCNILVKDASFDAADALKTILDEKITDIHIVPTQLVAVLNLEGVENYDLGCLKRIWYAASPMPVELLKRGLSVFGPIFLQGYGLTESGPHTTILSQSAHEAALKNPEIQNVLASCGHPCLGVQMRIVDANDNDLPPHETGEIILRSDRMMTAYWEKPEDTSEALKEGWLRTGDLGYYDEKGFVYITDRKKDMIVTGGENVYPKEVEDVLYRHPAVSEAAVIGVPDPYWVERVHAFVVLTNGIQPTERDIINFCRRHMAHYKAPKGVEFIESIPKNPQGKILKRELRNRYLKKTVI